MQRSQGAGRWARILPWVVVPRCLVVWDIGRATSYQVFWNLKHVRGGERQSKQLCPSGAQVVVEGWLGRPPGDSEPGGISLVMDGQPTCGGDVPHDLEMLQFVQVLEGRDQHISRPSPVPQRR